MSSAFKTRLFDERRDLVEKLAKLQAFFKTDTFLDLEQHNRFLMRKQAGIMADYIDVLDQRIDNLGG